jgi:hypothetical protein
MRHSIAEQFRTFVRPFRRNGCGRRSCSCCCFGRFRRRIVFNFLGRCRWIV